MQKLFEVGAGDLLRSDLKELGTAQPAWANDPDVLRRLLKAQGSREPREAAPAGKQPAQPRGLLGQPALQGALWGAQRHRIRGQPLRLRLRLLAAANSATTGAGAGGGAPSSSPLLRGHRVAC